MLWLKKSAIMGIMMVFPAVWNNIFEPVSEAIEVITSLAQNYQLALFSNTNKFHFNYLKGRYHDVFLLFNKFFLSYKMHLRKPEDEIFKQIIRYSDILPEEIFYVDDMEENVKAAKNNGIKVDLFTSQSELIRDLRNKNVRI
jgi:putative hydrolase of the HAD superfamily